MVSDRSKVGSGGRGPGRGPVGCKPWRRYFRRDGPHDRAVRSLTQGTSGNGAGNAKSEGWKNLKVTKIHLGCYSIFFLQM